MRKFNIIACAIITALVATHSGMNSYRNVAGFTHQIRYKSPVEPNSSVDYYKKFNIKAATKSYQCSEMLRELAQEPKEDINVRMREVNCFDRFAGYDINTSTATVSTFAELEISGSILTIRIPWFSEDLVKSLRKQINALTLADLNSITVVVIDFRFVPGGSTLALREFLEFFSPRQGMRYMEAFSRCGDLKDYETTEGEGILARRQYIVLVNEGTASSAEQATRELRYRLQPKATTVIGVNADHTVGKQTLLQEITLEKHPGYELKLKVTCGEWKTLGEMAILGIGITPDKTVTTSEGCRFEYACVMTKLGLPQQYATMIGH